MHASSFVAMKHLAAQICAANGGRLRVLDIGSVDINGSYRAIFDAFPGVHYVGTDLAAGRNVDIVLEDPYRIPVDRESFDLVVSGQVFEHVEYPWQTIREIARVLAPGGYAIIIAPSSGPEHRYPHDCWRFYPDGMRALAKWAELECVHVATRWEETRRFHWGDTVAVLRKPGGHLPALTLDAEIPWNDDYRLTDRLRRAFAVLAGRA